MIQIMQARGAVPCKRYRSIKRRSFDRAVEMTWATR